ncbi:hypothetical protein D9757_008771 [Collybiopsis confluens]|uniref:Uncharacterized protein n=1 Tax=Collybiopsis confluens TaxID=2823264 RepID=A0A8H5H5H2_9AGAR|nr:hypothetical protein D9757_008771 [Collybiopsis confluens]
MVVLVQGARGFFNPTMSSNPNPGPSDSRRGQRSASRKYEGRNGFTEPPTTLEQKLEVHEHALNILRFSAVPIPSLETILDTDWTKPIPETSASVQVEIDELRKNHVRMLSNLYDMNSVLYLADVEDRYQSRNEVLDEDPRVWMKREYTDNPDAVDRNYTEQEVDEMIEVSNAQKKLYESTYPYPFTATSPTPAHLPNISRLNYTYLHRLIPLYKKLKTLTEHERQKREQELYNAQRREEEARRLAQIEQDRLAKKFPTTVEEFNSKPKDFQNLIVKMLNASGTTQERQVTMNKWSPEEVTPLLMLFKEDSVFRSRIIGMSLSLNSSSAVSDPRRRIS